MIALVLGLAAPPHLRPAPGSHCRDLADSRAGARGAAIAARRRHQRKTADPRPRKCDLIENGFNQVLDATDPYGVTTFAWDGNGNQTEKAAPGGATTAYTWDARDRLSEIALPDGTTAAYGYDTDNLRVSMDDADGARRVLLDGLEEWGEVDEASGELAARFDHDPTRIDALLAQNDAAGHVAMLTDALGSVYGLADDGAALRARFGYDVYGARTAISEEIGTRWGLTGRTHAADGPAYYRARWYEAALGTFASRDPLGPEWGPPPPYGYADGAPTMRRDPLGLFLDSVRMAILQQTVTYGYLMTVGEVRLAKLVLEMIWILAGLAILAPSADLCDGDGNCTLVDEDVLEWNPARSYRDAPTPKKTKCLYKCGAQSNYPHAVATAICPGSCLPSFDRRSELRARGCEKINFIVR